MSSSTPSSPSGSSSSSSSSIYRTPIVTVTIFSPSATSHAQPANDNNAHTTIPIGSIVGGCLAGIILAVATVVGWHLWGRSIKRKEEAKRKETVSSLFTFVSLILSYCVLPSDITPCHRKEYKIKRVYHFPVLLPGPYPGSQSQVCRADVKYPA